MAEGDFGDRRMNHLLLGKISKKIFAKIVKIPKKINENFWTLKGPYKRVLEPVRNVAARPVYQKWDQPHIYLTYYR